MRMVTWLITFFRSKILALRKLMIKRLKICSKDFRLLKKKWLNMKNLYRKKRNFRRILRLTRLRKWWTRPILKVTWVKLISFLTGSPYRIRSRFSGIFHPVFIGKKHLWSQCGQARSIGIHKEKWHPVALIVTSQGLLSYRSCLAFSTLLMSWD